MTSFDQLHPGIQHHVVNSLGWRELRPFQEEVIPPILEGEHVLVIAPTAGGKTEAAILPVLSRMLSEDWRGLSVLYLCPIRALLNNLHVRLSRYATLIGRSCSLWHGDVSAGERSLINRSPPDILLTTPESLEVILVSSKTDALGLLGQVRAVIVDELHAFAGDDRGWHLLSVLQRVSRLAGRAPQRIGLSATVGNPDALLRWLSAVPAQRGRVVSPHAALYRESKVELDFVGSLANAAVVISRMHRGEKRLAFVDSRSRAEQVGAELRRLGVRTFVTHSSLSRDQRARAEAAFASEPDCVIVATSALELGIDVGDLDRVIQIDAPTKVSSLLQRMGRSGRREGTVSNCLFLATDRQHLLRAAGLIGLWSSGFVEPIIPPLKPLHIFAQQIMALALQLGGIERNSWREWIGDVPGFAALCTNETEEVLQHMIANDILWEDNGVLWFGQQGEAKFGFRNFMDLLSVFTGEPLISVRHGQDEIGFVHPSSFASQKDGAKTLLLGGRSWAVTHIDWKKRVAYTQATEEHGRSRWIGSGTAMSFELSRSIRKILATEDASEFWSRRAREELSIVRAEFPWVSEHETTVISNSEGVAWWTFAGDRANGAIARRFGQMIDSHADCDGMAVKADFCVSHDDLCRVINEIRAIDAGAFEVEISDEMLDGLKFSTCLPKEMSRMVLQLRLADSTSLECTLSEPIRFVSDGQ